MKSTLRGFTLVELLITIIVMGILSTLGLSAFRSAQIKSRDANRKAGLTAVVKALEGYLNDKGVYPPGSIDGEILWCGTSDAPNAEPCEWGGGFADAEIDPEEGADRTLYMAKLPKEPVSSQTYFYEPVLIDGSNKGYRLYARLENTNDQDIPLIDGIPAEYNTDCGAGTSSLHCNYFLASENVAFPTPIAVVVETSTPPLTSTPTTACIASGGDCTTGSCCSGSCMSFYMDADGDTYGGGTTARICSATPPTGYATTNTDCDDGNANVYPGSTYCGTVARSGGSFDYNCDGSISYCGSAKYGSQTCAITICNTEWECEGRGEEQECNSVCDRSNSSFPCSNSIQAGCGQSGFDQGIERYNGTLHIHGGGTQCSCNMGGFVGYEVGASGVQGCN